MAKDIRQFRHEASILKKKGLVPNDFDGRSIRPEDKPSLKKAIRKFSDIISGHSVAVKIPRSEISKYKSLNPAIRVARPAGLPPRMIVEKINPDEKIGVQSGHVFRSMPTGIKRVDVPVSRGKPLVKMLEELRHRKIGHNEYVAFNFGDNRSLATFSNFEQAINYLTDGHYPSITDAIDKNNTQLQRQLVRAITFVTVSNPNEWHAERERRKERRKIERKRNWKRVYEIRKKKLHARGNLHLLRLYKMRKAERDRQYREHMKNYEPEKYRAMLEANAKRSAKSKRRKKRKNE